MLSTVPGSDLRLFAKAALRNLVHPNWKDLIGQVTDAEWDQIKRNSELHFKVFSRPGAGNGKRRSSGDDNAGSGDALIVEIAFKYNYEASSK